MMERKPQLIEQRKPEWFRARVGKATGSTAHRLMGTADKRETFICEKVSELLMGEVHVNYPNDNMQFGIDNEDAAIREYELVTGEMARPGYWIDMEGWGCTPDAFVIGESGDAGLLSIKCTMIPSIAIHRRFETKLKIEHYWQCMAEMTATGLPWCDLALYCPKFPDRADWLFIRRVEWDAEKAQEMLNAIAQFNDDVDNRLYLMKHDPRALRLKASEPLPVAYDDPERYMYG